MSTKRSQPKIDSQSARARLEYRNEPYFSAAAPYLAVGFRASKDGDNHGSFIARLQRPGDKRIYQRLGLAEGKHLPADGENVLDFEMAVEAARRWRDRIARGTGEGDIRNLTVGQAVDDYLNGLRKSKKSTYDTTKSRLNKHLPDALRRTAVSKVSYRQILRWRDNMIDVGLSEDKQRAARASANRCLAALRAALNLVADHSGGEVSSAAWSSVKMFRDVSVARKIFLSAVEARQLISAAPTGPERDIIEAGFATACRFGELAQCRIGHVELNAGIWHLQHGKTGARTVVLTPAAVDVFRRAIGDRDSDEDLIFLHPDDISWQRHNIRPVVKRAVKAAGLAPATTFYAARHSAISWMLKANVPMQAISENAGTSIRMIEKVYGKFLTQDKRDLLAGGMPTLAQAEILPFPTADREGE